MKPAIRNSAMTCLTKSKNYLGMMPNNDIAEVSTDVLLKEQKRIQTERLTEGIYLIVFLVKVELLKL